MPLADIEARRAYDRARAKKRYEAERANGRTRRRGYDPVASRAAYQAWKARHPDGLWEQWLKASHGMRPEQWLAMWDDQLGLCYLCEQELPADRSKVSIDHDHAHCGEKRTCKFCRRGLTHNHCNWILGLLKEDPALMAAVVAPRFLANFLRTQAQAQALLATAPAQTGLWTA